MREFFVRFRSYFIYAAFFSLVIILLMLVQGLLLELRCLLLQSWWVKLAGQLAMAVKKQRNICRQQKKKEWRTISRCNYSITFKKQNRKNYRLF